jgi:hypothetical protein
MRVFAKRVTSIVLLLILVGCAEIGPMTIEESDPTPVKGPLSEPRSGGSLSAVMVQVNRLFVLPVEVTAEFTSCGEANAFYDPNTHAITLCDELLVRMRELFALRAPSEEELNEAVASAISFIFSHELGHALVHVLDLPVTGREEDAVDQFAAWVSLQVGQEGERVLLFAASWFHLEAVQREDLESLPFWDEHSLDAQRFYNIACWAYGKDPERYAWLVQEGHLPQKRAERCEEEYSQIIRSWSTLLEPHMRK